MRRTDKVRGVKNGQCRRSTQMPVVDRLKGDAARHGWDGGQKVWRMCGQPVGGDVALAGSAQGVPWVKGGDT
jgi:hypothetical protein